MKFKQISTLMAGLLSCGAMAQPTTPAPGTSAIVPPTNATPAKPAEPPDKAQLSYALGFYYGGLTTNTMMTRQSGLEPKLDLDLGRFFEAFSNVLSGTPTTMNNEEATKILQQEVAYKREEVQAEIEKVKATGPENKVKGEKFMEEMAAKPGVTKLTSGVLYKVIKQGDGEMPAVHDSATVSFQASLIDGTEVAKLEHRPVTVAPPGLPAGLVEALTLMKAGSHWMIYLPYNQAFGEQPGIPDPKHGYKVGPFSALVFDLELDSVQRKPAAPAGMMPPGMQPPGMQPPGATGPGTSYTPPPSVTSSSIVRVPSAEDMKRGEKPRVMTDAEIEAAKAEAAKAAQTNSTGPK